MLRQAFGTVDYANVLLLLFFALFSMCVFFFANLFSLCELLGVTGGVIVAHILENTVVVSKKGSPECVGCFRGLFLGAFEVNAGHICAACILESGIIRG